MCGIYGLVNGIKSRKVSGAISKMVHDGMVVNSLRGMDSTGVFQLDKKNVTFTHKLALSGSEFVKDKYSISFINDADMAKYTVVHNRAATEGKVSEENAHPFESLDEATYNYTCGVHNGTLTGWKDKPGASGFEVDSQWAIHHINKMGNDAFKDFTGAWAMVWASDNEVDKLKMCRNHQRPMYFAYVKNEDQMIFGSEYQMLTWIAERNNIALEPDIYELTAGFIYSFDVDNPRNFSRVTTPFYTAADHEKKRRDEYIREVENILKPTKKGKAAKKRALEEAAEREAVRQAEKALVVAKPASVASAIEEGNTPPKYATREEFQLAKKLGVLRAEVTFEGWAYDPETLEWWGSIGKEEDLTTCVMRNVDKVTYDTLDRAHTLRCRIVGAIPGESGRDGDVSYILSRNILAVEEEQNQLELSELGKALAESLAAHNRDRINDAKDDNETGFLHF